MEIEEEKGFDDRLMFGLSAKCPYNDERRRRLWQRGVDQYDKELGEERYRTPALEGEFGDDVHYIVGHVWHK